MEIQKAGHSERLQAIHSETDLAQKRVLYKTYNTGIHWVDALNGTVRPVIAYAFFVLYAYVKYEQISHTPWLMWTEDDQAIFAGIISFYFGQRAWGKLRKSTS
jgi:hypothetical protein